MTPAPTRRPWLERLGRFQARHARAVVGAWLVLIVLGFLVSLGALGGGSVFDRLTSGAPLVPGEARTGDQLLSARATTGPRLILDLQGADPRAEAVRTRVTELGRQAAAVPGVLAVTTPYDLPADGTTGPATAPASSASPGQSTPTGATPPLASVLIGRDGRGLLVLVDLRPDLPKAAQTTALTSVQSVLGGAASGLPGTTARVGGGPLLLDEITHQVEVDLRTGEGIALPITLAVMVLVFGGFLAAGMPLAGAIASIAGAFVSLDAFSRAIDLDATVVNVVTILGLGLCIDYGLLTVSRFREELRAHPGQDVEEALGRTVLVAGQTVLFSGLIVGISLCGLLIFRASILRALGAAGVSVVVVALLVALTFVPALIGVAGARLARPGVLTRMPGLRPLLRRFGDVAPVHGVFSNLATRVQRHPWWTVVGVVAVLVALAAPVLTMQVRSSGVDLLPRGADQRTFFEQLDRNYPLAGSPEVTVVARADLARVSAWAEQVAQLPGVEAVVPPRPIGDLVTLGVQVRGNDASGPVAAGIVRTLRAERPQFPIWVTGQAAAQADFSHDIRERAPAAAALVVLATVVLLFLMTGSVLVPLKALLMNVVSLGASLGVIVLIFQRGHLEGLLGFTATGGLESTIPPLVLAFGFGLAMDYEVFLLSRIKEQHDRGMTNDQAVVRGLQLTGRIITCAALLVMIVFAGLVAGRLLVVKETGLALAVAVAIDATLVRMLLVPATMTLLGEWNWWAPGPLRRLHTRIALHH